MKYHKKKSILKYFHGQGVLHTLCHRQSNNTLKALVH